MSDEFSVVSLRHRKKNKNRKDKLRENIKMETTLRGKQVYATGGKGDLGKGG